MTFSRCSAHDIFMDQRHSRGSGGVQAGYLPKIRRFPLRLLQPVRHAYLADIVVAVVRCSWACSRVSVRR
jgi:hypothetical protein